MGCLADRLIRHQFKCDFGGSNESVAISRILQQGQFEFGRAIFARKRYFATREWRIQANLKQAQTDVALTCSSP